MSPENVQAHFTLVCKPFSSFHYFFLKFCGVFIFYFLLSRFWISCPLPLPPPPHTHTHARSLKPMLLACSELFCFKCSLSFTHDNLIKVVRTAKGVLERQQTHLSFQFNPNSAWFFYNRMSHFPLKFSHWNSCISAQFLFCLHPLIRT